MTSIPITTETPSTIPAATSKSSAGGSSSTTSTQPGGALGENEFLQLMMDQLKNQNPLNPSDPTQFVSELAGFTTLEQETNIAQTSAQAAQQQSTATALSLLGHTVSYTDTNGNTETGLVQKVDLTSSSATLTVGGVAGIAPTRVVEVS